MTPSPRRQSATYPPQGLIRPGFIGGDNLDMEGICVGRIDAVLDAHGLAPAGITPRSDGDDIDIDHRFSRYPTAMAPRRVERSALSWRIRRRPLAPGVG